MSNIDGTCVNTTDSVASPKLDDGRLINKGWRADILYPSDVNVYQRADETVCFRPLHGINGVVCRRKSLHGCGRAILAIKLF